MSTAKITLREDCGNSPKNEFVQKLTVAFATGDADSVAERVSDDVRWNIVGRTRAHASFVHRKDDNNVDIGTANGLTLGITHGLSARTDVYVLASHVKNKKSVSIPYPVSWSANPQAGQSPTGIAFGIRHAF